MCKKWAMYRLLRKASHYCKYKDLPMWKVGGKIVDGEVNPCCQCTAAGRFLCCVIRFIGGHEALGNVTTLIIYRGGSRARAREAWGSPSFQTKLRLEEHEKKCFETAPPPSPALLFPPSLYPRIWMTGPTPYLKVWIREWYMLES